MIESGHKPTESERTAAALLTIRDSLRRCASQLSALAGEVGGNPTPVQSRDGVCQRNGVALTQTAKKMVPTILDEAAAVVAGDRQRDYGNPAESHGRIAKLWSAYLSCRENPAASIDGADVARMMILLKIARDTFTPSRDNLVDVCGYARCLERMREVATT